MTSPARRNHPVENESFDILFREARTYNGWLKRDVGDDLLHSIHDLCKWGPTSANCSPMRTVFIKSPEAKARLKSFLDKGNVDKTMAAPVSAVFAFDMEFYNHLPRLFPHTDAKSWFVGNDTLIEETAWRNGTLQAGYFILAARAAGLDCGPMSGFDKNGVKEAFFAGENVRVNFLCNLGYGDPASLHPRSPRFDFPDVCRIV